MEKWPSNNQLERDSQTRKNEPMLVKCYVCNGTGKKDGKTCKECNGGGKVRVRG